MGNDKFLKLCKEIVVNYFNDRSDKTDKRVITGDDVFIVWSCKTLQNNKALVSTTVSDGMYYEITYNGDKNEVYLDAYKKWENKKITDIPGEIKYPPLFVVRKTCDGCRGAEGLIGHKTDEPHTDGLLSIDPGYNVDTGDGHIWRINPDAKIEYLE